jgi:hypothetical protein
MLRRRKVVVSSGFATLAFFVALKAKGHAQNGAPARFPIVRDWSHRYLVYGNGSFRAPTPSRLERDPRLIMAWLQRSLIGALGQGLPPARRSGRRDGAGVKRDWAVSLGDGVLTPGPAEAYPAMYGGDIARGDCANDFVVFGINAKPATNQANIAAFYNLYDNCRSGPVPQVLWAYRVGTGPVRTSPVLSLNGQEVAFVENSANGAAFHVLSWARGQGSIAQPAVPVNGSALRTLTYSRAPSTRSSPFVDYWNNVAFVGADDGILYAIGPVFGTSQPLAIKAAVTANSGRILTSPVMDPGANRVFVSDGNTLYCYSYDGSFRLQGSYSTGAAGTEAVQDAALVDVDRQRIFWFTNAGSETALVIETDYNCGAVKTAFIARNSDTVLRAGAFDNKHYELGGRGGQLLLCGMRDNMSGHPALYAFEFDAQGSWNTTPRYVIRLANKTGSCSPLTSFMSGGQDRLFFGFSGTNEVQMWHLPITGMSWGPSARAPGYAGGSGGITVDNRSADPARNNIYFQTLERSPACAQNGVPKVCAVKLSQSALE